MREPTIQLEPQEKERKYDSLIIIAPLANQWVFASFSFSFFFFFFLDYPLWLVVVNVFASSPSKSSKAFLLFLDDCWSCRSFEDTGFFLFFIWESCFSYFISSFFFFLPHIQPPQTPIVSGGRARHSPACPSITNFDFSFYISPVFDLGWNEREEKKKKKKKIDFILPLLCTSRLPVVCCC